MDPNDTEVPHEYGTHLNRHIQNNIRCLIDERFVRRHGTNEHEIRHTCQMREYIISKFFSSGIDFVRPGNQCETNSVNPTQIIREYSSVIRDIRENAMESIDQISTRTYFIAETNQSNHKRCALIGCNTHTAYIFSRRSEFMRDEYQSSIYCFVYILLVVIHIINQLNCCDCNSGEELCTGVADVIPLVANRTSCIHYRLNSIPANTIGE